MSAVSEWSREIVLGWIGTITDEETLRAWFYACRSRLVAIGAPRKGFPLKTGERVYATSEGGTHEYVLEEVRPDVVWPLDMADPDSVIGVRYDLVIVRDLTTENARFVEASPGHGSHWEVSGLGPPK